MFFYPKQRESVVKWPFSSFSLSHPWLDPFFRDLSFVEKDRPSLNCFESDDAYLVEVDLPGVKKEDIQVELTGLDLRVQGKKDATGKGTAQTKQSLIEFERTLHLPHVASDSKIDANLANGVLKIQLAKSTVSKVKLIPIH